MIRIDYLSLTENNSDKSLNYAGWTIRPGSFFGVAVVSGGIYPVFWSGAISRHDIKLYFIGAKTPLMPKYDSEGKPFPAAIWVGEDEVENFHINADRSFVDEFHDEQTHCSMFGYCEPDEGAWIPWFAMDESDEEDEDSDE